MAVRPDEGKRSPRRASAPVEADAVTVVAIGTAMWGVLLVLCLVLLGRLTASGHRWWLWTCVAGFVLGLYGEWYCIRRRNKLRRRGHSTGR